MVEEETLARQHCLLTWDTLVRTADLSCCASNAHYSCSTVVYVGCGRDCVFSAHQTQGAESDSDAAASNPQQNVRALEVTTTIITRLLIHTGVVRCLSQDPRLLNSWWQPAGGEAQHAQHHPGHWACFIHHLSCGSGDQADETKAFADVECTQSVSQELIREDEQLVGISAGRQSFLLALSRRSTDEAYAKSRMGVLRLDGSQAADVTEENKSCKWEAQTLTEEAVSWAAGGNHYLVGVHTGAVLGWGGNLHHQSSEQDVLEVREPQILKSLLGVRVAMVSAGLNHSLALSDCGDVYSWGANECGQLGHGTIAQGEAKPRLIERIGNQDGSEVTLSCISAGSRHCLAMDQDGMVYGWGWAELGQLGKCSEKHGQLLVHAKECMVECCGGSTGLLLSRQQDHSLCLLKRTPHTCKLALMDSTGLLKRSFGRSGQMTATQFPEERCQQCTGSVRGSNAGDGGTKRKSRAYERTGEPEGAVQKCEHASRVFVDDKSHGQCVLEPVGMCIAHTSCPEDTGAEPVQPLVAASCRAEWWHSIIVFAGLM